MRANRLIAAVLLVLAAMMPMAQATTATANFTVTIGPPPPQSIASIAPPTASVAAPCADGTVVTALTATMSNNNTPPFSGTWMESGDSHFRIANGNQLVCNDVPPGTPVPANTYTPLVTATPTNTAIAAKSATVTVTVQSGGQTVASIDPLWIAAPTTPCTNGTIVAALTATMSPAAPAFSGTWSVTGDTHFAINGSNLVCNGSVATGDYTPTLTATPSNTGIPAKSQAAALTVGCTPGHHGTSRGHSKMVYHGSIVAEDGCLLRALHVVDFGGNDTTTYGLYHSSPGHFNTLRYLGFDRPSDSTVLSEMDNIVSTAASVGMYVLISDAIGTGGLPGCTPNCDYNLSESQAFWGTIAPRYKDDPWVIYEISNEIDTADHVENGISSFTGTMWDYIRSRAPNTPIIVFSSCCENFGLGWDTRYLNTVYGFHVYTGIDLNNALSQQASGIPTMMNESADASGLAVTQFEGTWAANGISWGYLSGAGFWNAADSQFYGFHQADQCDSVTCISVSWPAD